ncbi:hypothetical protein [Terrabacter sp. NPDC000476]|uniref:hypothetical protein n=1 Tax=Terrabacter sp. NPDC000476 TaxID=3154258 RepID=UPI003327672F
MAEWRGFRSAEQEVELRQLMAYFFEQVGTGQAKSGVLPSPSSSRLQVQQTATASASVQVIWGACIVQDARTDGITPLVSNNTKTVNVLGGSPMGALPRNDLIVFDAVTGSIVPVIGTPNASPTDPTPPNSHLKLARIRNAANATAIPSSAIDDLRTFTSLNSALSSVTDSDWVSISVASGKAGQAGVPPQVRKVGNQVFIRWGWAGTGLTTPNASVVAGTVPASHRPTVQAVSFEILGSTANQRAMCVIDTTGTVTIRIGAAPCDYYLFSGELNGWFVS